MAFLFVDNTTFVTVVEDSTTPDTPIYSYPKNGVTMKVANTTDGYIQIVSNDNRIWGFRRSELAVSQQGADLLACVNGLMALSCTSQA